MVVGLGRLVCGFLGGFAFWIDIGQFGLVLGCLWFEVACVRGLWGLVALTTRGMRFGLVSLMQFGWVLGFCVF